MAWFPQLVFELILVVNNIETGVSYENYDPANKSSRFS